jgi:cobalamin biosynthesis protein CbiD
MQRIFSAIGQAFGKGILIFGLMSLLSLSGLFIFANQPALADKPLQADEKIDRAYTMSEATGLIEEDRQEAYDEAAEAVSEDPKQGLEKIYEADLNAYEKENPDENGLIEGAKELVEKVTGK